MSLFASAGSTWLIPNRLASPSAHFNCNLAVACLTHPWQEEIFVERLNADISLSYADKSDESAASMVALGISYDLRLLDRSKVFEEIRDFVLVPDLWDLAHE